MKKHLLVVAGLACSVALYSQEITSKKGEIYLPEGGDWAIGFDATPFLDYAGNAFNGAISNNAPTADFVNNNMAIYGKMFRDASTAYRAMIRIGFGSTTQDSIVQDLSPSAGATDVVTNSYKTNSMNVTLGAGLEKRRGNTRLQGYYGGEALITLGSFKETWEYGNLIQDEGLFARTTEDKQGSTFGFTVRGFIGAEYFLFPKISIAGEYGWGVGLASTGEGEVTTETYDGTNTSNVVTKTGGNSAFGLDTDNTGGSLRLLFHF